MVHLTNLLLMMHLLNVPSEKMDSILAITLNNISAMMMQRGLFKFLVRTIFLLQVEPCLKQRMLIHGVPYILAPNQQQNFISLNLLK